MWEIKQVPAHLLGKTVEAYGTRFVLLLHCALLAAVDGGLTISLAAMSSSNME